MYFATFLICYRRVFICKINFLDGMTIEVMSNPGTNNYWAPSLIIRTNKCYQDYLFMFSCIKFKIFNRYARISFWKPWSKSLIKESIRSVPPSKGVFLQHFCVRGPSRFLFAPIEEFVTGMLSFIHDFLYNKLFEKGFNARRCCVSKIFISLHTVDPNVVWL